jgi:subtilase family serine protease
MKPMSMKTSMRKPQLTLVLILTLGPGAFAQSHDRLNRPIDSRRQVSLENSRKPPVAGLAEGGPLSPAERIQGMMFRFKPTASQNAALARLLEDQQNPSSPSYHAWLSPEEFADRFGLTRNDYARVGDWLASEGFQVEGVSRSRTSIHFSGSVDRVRRTLGADLHRFRVNGRAHFATVTEARIPADLEPLIQTLTGLDDLPANAQGRTNTRIKLRDGGNALGPGDLATIYNIKPLLEKGYDGTGQKIVVAGKSALRIEDVREFRSLFKLPANDPQVILVPGYSDPGENEEFLEVTADVELAGAIAPNVSILYVYAPNGYAGIQYAVDQNLAPVISFSFGTCERGAASSTGLIDWTRALAQQANAQGITWISSSGDTGVAACEHQFVDHTGVGGAGVLLPVSFPEVTGVGGTMFVEC